MIVMQQREKKSLRRYLLGEAAEEERSQVEQRLFTDEDPRQELKLVHSGTFSKGIVVLEYEQA